MKKLITTLLVLFGFALPASAQVYTLDFINDDDNGADFGGNNERGELDGTILEFDGIYVMVSATAPEAEGYAYFDAGTAGLGVCGTLDGDRQCDPGSDDNLTEGETLTLSFFADAQGQETMEVRMFGIVFRQADHSIIVDDSTFTLNGSEYVMSTFGISESNTSFTFGYGERNPNQYYLSSMFVTAVPEPATWLMMILGFGIVASAARRRRSVASSLA